MTDQVENTNEVIGEATAAADSLAPNSKPAADPKSRVEMMASVLNGMGKMPSEELTKWFTQAMAVFGPGKDHGVGDKSGHNQSSIDMHASAAQATTGPKTKDAMPKLSVKEDVEEMFAGQDLSEEFKDKASVLFEAAISARLAVETARLEEEMEVKLEESLSEIHEEVVNNIDSYLNYVVERWMEDNEVAVESALRNEIMEEFIDGLKNLFAEHYIDVPQDKVDVIESLADKVAALEQKLDEAISENAEIKNSLLEVEKDNVIADVAEDLTMSQQEKFAALAEGIEFDGDLEKFADKLQFVKESYFGAEKKATTTNIEEETFEGEVSPQTVSVDPAVNKYVQAIARSVKR